MTLPQLQKELQKLCNELAALPEEERFPRYLEAVNSFPLKCRELAETYLTTMVVIGYHREPKGPNVLVHSGTVAQIGSGPMSNTSNSQNISGGTFSGPVGVNQSFSNYYNAAATISQQDAQQLLKALIAEVQKIHPQLSESDQTKVTRKLQLLTEEAAQPEPDKEQLAVSSKGLLDTIKSYADLAPSVIAAVKAVAACFGYKIP